MLAPLHNPANLAGIVAAKKAFPTVPHVAVFDTAFHQSLAPEAYTYAIDREVAEAHRIRRYGFHGTSHKFVSEAAAAFVGRPLGELKQIVFHLGNGASVAAIEGGRSVDTSMGLTPSRVSSWERARAISTRPCSSSSPVAPRCPLPISTRC